MNAHQIIQQTSAMGIRLAAKDGRLVVDAPRGVLNEELRTTLAANKAELLHLLAANQPVAREPKAIAWAVTVGADTFTMIRPGGMTKEEALEAARARWPGATVEAKTGGGL